MGPNGVPSLRLQVERALQQPVHPHLLSYCPTMDLIAVVNQAEQLDVYRLNGQRAFGLKQKAPDCKVDAICWKFNGTCIAVAWDDGSVDVVSSDTGKVIRHGMTESLGTIDRESPSRISSLGWGVSLIDTESIKARTGISRKPKAKSTTTDFWLVEQDDATLDDFLDRQPDISSQELNPDLPNQLALTDVESLLPKLPPLPLPPQTGMMGMMRMSRDSGPEIFTSQASVDAMLHSYHLKDPNSVDVLIRCYEGGMINPIIFDSLEIGRMQLPEAWNLPDIRPILTCSHPFSCSQNMLVEIGSSGKSSPRLALVPLSLRFIPSAGLYLHLIASRTAQLQQLLRYVHQCLKCIGDYWRHSQDLPSKWLANADEMLAEKSEGNIVQSLFNLAVTGSCSPTLKEWLMDDVGENNHKRWDNACNQGYTKIVELTHENLLPALDRCNLVICTLRGLAKYHDSSQILDVPVKDFTDLLDIIRCLTLLGHTILSYAAEDKRQFATFSAWMRLEMANQRSDSNEESSIDSEIGSAFPDLLSYIQGSLMGSHLKPYLTATPSEEALDPTELTYNNVRRAISQHKEGKAYEAKALRGINVSLLLQRLARDLFNKITAWQIANSSMNCGLVLESTKCISIDSRMCPEEEQHDHFMVTYVAAIPETMPHQIRFHRIRHTPEFIDIDTSVEACGAVTFDFGHGTVKDVKFVDDESLMVILEAQEESYLLKIPYVNRAQESTFRIPFEPLCQASTRKSFEPMRLPNGSGDTSRSVMNLSQPDAIRPLVQHVFPKVKLFIPVKLETNGRKDRRVVLILAEDLKHYKVFDLDFQDLDTTADEDMAMEED